MSSESQSGLGSRLLSSKDLITLILTYALYSPILDIIKIAVYQPFVAAVEAAMVPYDKAKEAHDQLDNGVEIVFDNIVDIARSIRNVLIELYGNESGEYADYNEILDILTGDNVTKNSYKRKHSGKETLPGEDFQSVAQLDRGSKLRNFALLIAALEDNSKYLPPKTELKVVNLKLLYTDASAKNDALITAYGIYIKERGKVLPMFDGIDGLAVRAARAKAHVSYMYGPHSAELKALTGKTY